MKTPKASVLIVDDNPSMARTISLILGGKGYAVDVAEDGPVAIDQVRKRSYHVVLMDIKMPLMNGVEAYKRMKEICPTVTVILMTAFAVDDLVAEARREGAYDVVYKPLDIDHVLDLIERARRERGGATVMVVDDDPGICVTLRRILERRGYIVTTVLNGEEAIALAQRQHYDAILIDLNLPTINGLETCLAIHDFDVRAMTIMMTGYRVEMMSLVDESLRNLARACLYKPLDLDRLMALLDGLARCGSESCGVGGSANS